MPGCLLICEMAAEAKAMCRTLVDKLNEIYAEYGYYHDAIDTFTLRGKDGLEKISSMMSGLRTSGAPVDGIKSVIDYSVPIEAEPGFGTLPRDNEFLTIVRRYCYSQNALNVSFNQCSAQRKFAGQH